MHRLGALCFFDCDAHGRRKAERMSHARIRVRLSGFYALALFALASLGACASLEIESPYEGRPLALADAKASCTESGRFGQWSLLFGVAPVIRANPAELFPSADSAYRVRTEYGWLDAAISLIGGSFLSLHKNTLVVERCAVSAPAESRPATPEVELQSGEVHRGRILRITETEVIIQTEAGERALARDQILEIRVAPPAESPVAPAAESATTAPESASPAPESATPAPEPASPAPGSSN